MRHGQEKRLAKLEGVTGDDVGPKVIIRHIVKPGPEGPVDLGPCEAIIIGGGRVLREHYTTDAAFYAAVEAVSAERL